MASLMDNLVEVLEKENGEYEKLVELAQQKKKALVKSDIAELERVTEQEQEVSGALSELGEVDRVILRTADIGVNRTFAAHKTDICFISKQSCHGLICAEAGNKGEINSFFLKVPLFNGNIHRCIENGMCHFIQCDRSKGTFGTAG